MTERHSKNPGNSQSRERAECASFLTMASHIYKITFFNQGQIYEVFAREISQGGLFGFVEIEQLVFGEKTKVVVDPSEERLKKEFEGVKRSYIPMHAIVRIDEVEKEGTGRILPQDDEGGRVTPFPMPVFTPGGDSGKK